jgi:glutamate formiminotransferase
MVTAFSGEQPRVRDTLFAVADVAFDRIDMRSHEGVHPRIGALDVCPFISLESGDDAEFVLEVAADLASTYDLPTFLYEKSETGKHAADLPSLRKGQYEGLVGRPLDPDFGPKVYNPKLGAAVVGLRDWLIAMNVNFSSAPLSQVRQFASEIRRLRDGGDPRFTGIRALGLPLASRHITQVSLNLTKPDVTSPDAIVAWLEDRAGHGEPELIGVIRARDLANAVRMPWTAGQVIP